MNPSELHQDLKAINDSNIDYKVFETLHYPVCIISHDGLLTYRNEFFKKFIQSSQNELRLDWSHPLFPEYRKRVANAYMSAMKGHEKQCFAVINSDDGKQIPVEIYLFPMYNGDEVSSILSMMRIVDDRLLSFDGSTLSLISEENFQYENLVYEFSPIPMLRINDKNEITRCSQALEGLMGYSNEDIFEKKKVDLEKLFSHDYERVTKAIHIIMNGEIPFKRIGEVKLCGKGDIERIVNLTLYPIVQNNQITSIEIGVEDISKVYELKNKVNTANRIQLFGDITKGFLHFLNNSINVILSKTQLLLQITEKETVIDGISLIENSAIEIGEHIRRVQGFILESASSQEDATEPLVNIIEDSIEFSKIQFKVEDNEKNRLIDIEKKYFSSESIQTDTRRLREIIISSILKVSLFIKKKGNIKVELKENTDTIIDIRVEKDKKSDPLIMPSTINIFSGIDIRQSAEKIGYKIIEEESADSYGIKIILPQRMILSKNTSENEKDSVKVRDLDIIIAEDEPALQKILFEMFDRMGNRVFVCESGTEALEEFKRKSYDLVITDYGLSGLTGIELAARVKEISEDTVTVLLSGWMINDLKVYKNVIDLFLPKPFKLEELIKEISKLTKQ